MIKAKGCLADKGISTKTAVNRSSTAKNKANTAINKASTAKNKASTALNKASISINKANTAKNIERRAVYSRNIVDRVCEQIISGESMTDAAKVVGVGLSTIYRWLKRYEYFSTAYKVARQIRADIIFDEMDTIEKRVLIGDLEPQKARVVLDSIRWRLVRMSPKKYSEKSISGSLFTKGEVPIILDIAKELDERINKNTFERGD